METRRIIRSAGLVGLFTLFSRVLGLARDVLMAGLFGTGLHMSAFVIAFLVPNLFRRLFGEGALSAAFIPVFIKTKADAGPEVAWLLARRVITFTALLLCGLVLVGWLLMMALDLSGLPGPMTRAVLPLLEIMLPYMIFICLAALAMALLNAFHHFGTSALMPCILNVVWIIVLLVFAPRYSGEPHLQIRVVAWGVLLAGCLQLAGQIPALMRRGYRPGISLDTRDPQFRKVFRLMMPAALGLAVTQVNVVVDKLLAGWIGPWAAAALFFSERLIYLPLSIFATAMGTVLLPVLSGHAANSDDERMRQTCEVSLRNLSFVLIPAAAGLMALARPIVQTIYEWKSFGAASTDQTSIALQCYAPGLIFFGAIKMLVPAFYARQDTRTPVRLSALTVVLNFSLNILLILTLPLPVKHAGLAAATVLSSGFYVLCLSMTLQRRGLAPAWRPILVSAARAATAAVIMAILAWNIHAATLHGVAELLPAKTGQIIALCLAIGIAAPAYLLLCLLLRCPELDALRQRLRRRGGSVSR